MTNISMDSLDFDRLGKRALPATACLVILSFVLIVGLLFQIASRQDQHAADQAQAFARAALLRRNAIIAKDVKDYAAWGEAYQHLHAQTDVDWAYARQNLGRTLFTDLGYDDVLVVGPDNVVTYAVVAGELATGTVLSGRALDALVRDAKMATPGESKPVTGYVVADGMPFLVAATAITTGGDPTISLRPGPPSVLVFAHVLTPARLVKIGDAAFVQELRADIVPSDPLRSDQHLVRDADGGRQIGFQWTPERPGRRLLLLVMPWVTIASIGFSALIYLILRRTLLTAKLIERNARDLAAAHRRSEHMALHDAVTGLANRIKLDSALGGMLQQLEAPDCLAVLYIDLDRFKKINDQLGHRAGDAVLIETAVRLRAAVDDVNLVCRVGGDEFVVILARLENPKEAERVGSRLLQAVQAPIAIDGTIVQVGLSIGISVVSTSVFTADEVLRQADLAMYEAKMAGGDAFRFYSAELHGVAA